MTNIIITKNQLETLMSDSKPNLKESKDGEYMSKQHLFTIATLAYKMWEMLEEGEEIDDWMESKIAQAEQGITSVVKAYLYDEYAEKDQKVSGMSKLDYDDLIIGQ
jgi:hypothetical protein